MAPYDQYTDFYDSVNSHAGQPQGYTYQTSTGTRAPYAGSTTSNHRPPAYQDYNAAFGDQRYDTATQNPEPTSGDNRAAAAVLSNLGAQARSFAQSESANRPSNLSHLFNASSTVAKQSQTQTSYGQYPSRDKSNTSPTYPSNTTSTSFGRFFLQGASQGDINSYGDSQNVYQTVPPSGNNSQTHNHSQAYQTSQDQRSNRQQQQPPPRHKSPLHATQIQQSQLSHYSKSPVNATRRLSPRMTSQDMQRATHQRQQSVDPSQTTVDPSQVYDFRAEQQRKAEMEAQKRRKAEAEEAVRKAAQMARQQERDRNERDRQKTEEDQAHRAAEEAAKTKAIQERRKEQRRTAREEKRQGHFTASALQPTPSSGVNVDDSAAAGTVDAAVTPGDEESQMRSMFKKMREFNQRNPAMLAQLWEEERQAHGAASHASKASPATTMQSSANEGLSTSSTPSASNLSKMPSNPPATAPLPTVTTPASTQIQSEPPGNANAPNPAIHSTGSVDTSRIVDATQQQATTTLWPPHKRSILADTASRWLSNLPANRACGRTMSKEDVLKFLDSNPSYAQLCEAIERFGITFERSALARELLKVVPGGLKAQTVPKPSSTVANQPNGLPKSVLTNRNQDVKPQANTTTVSYQVPSFTSLANVARNVSGLNAVSSVPVQAPGLQAVEALHGRYQGSHIGRDVASADRAQTSSNPPEANIRITTATPEHHRAPANKEEAARKRTFSDLVDLTAGDSDDDMPPRKILQLSSNAPPNSTDQHQYNNFRAPMTFEQFRQASYHPRPPQGHLPGHPHMHPSIPPKLNSPALPAAGPDIIPTSAPAPAPTPLPAPSKPRGPSAEQQQVERIRGKVLVEPLMRDRVARKSKYDVRTIARDVLLATGRHPDMRALNAHLNTMDKLLSTHGGATDGIGNKSDLSTIRWDIIDPSETSRPIGAVNSAAIRDDEIEDADDDEDDAPMPRHTPNSKSKFTGPAFRITTPSKEGRFTERARRGRPPKSTAPGQDHLRNSRDAMSLSATPTGTDSAVGYAAFRRVDENGNVIKKKGRPIGWRKSIHSREANGMPPKTAPMTAKTRPGPTPKKELELQKPHCEVYHCRWRDCNGELHNLGALKKHIIKVHGQVNGHGVFECAWRGCQAGRANSDSQGTQFVDPFSFNSLESWMHHVDKHHLQNVAWKLGDGPRGGTVSDQSDSEVFYLSDARGRSVTPVISTKPSGTPQYSSIMLASGRRLDGKLTKDEQAAAEELKQLEEVKQVEGPHMGTEGTRLANAKRRLGFLDDEDFADEVDSSELGED